MQIKIGRYILNADGQCYWIDEEYMGKDAKGNEKLQARRVTGYFRRIEQLAADFPERKVRNIEAASVKELLDQLAKWHKEASAEFNGYLEQIINK